ncbi:carboxymuconolactone decarboxylase family protein [Vibrio parahaemolyticus]|jgi:AhpD family alkylhydroperoxidase|uniref:carboxymuconolactone decarboxylase family protein n=1 Tax=Vibrio parahaemolyticus TaxID=670 RepID=UPI003AB0DCD0
MHDTLTFHNTRFDPTAMPFHDIAMQLAASVGYTADIPLDPQLAQLLRLRVAQLNPCAYCLVLHTKAAHERGIEADKVAHLAAFRESALYTPAEKAALGYCEDLTHYAHQDFAKTHDALSAHFSADDIAYIAAVVINMNLWTRLKLAQGATPEYTPAP